MRHAVVICLKNRTFAVSQTAKAIILSRSNGCDLLEKSYFCSITNSSSLSHHSSFMLWFAWKIVLLQYHKQHYTNTKHYHNGCDLLEKSYFCSITNSKYEFNKAKTYVVICLKNRTFAVSQTARKKRYKEVARCDLLEKSYFCSITNSLSFYLTLPHSVVICLKNRTFAVSQTATRRRSKQMFLLWFAWKIVLLQYHKQQFRL